MDPTSKLLSHRARGWGAPEHSPDALAAALRAGVPYIEVDTRVSRDGQVFLHHDAAARSRGGGRVRLASHAARSIDDRVQPSLLTLDAALDLVRSSGSPDQRLCIDVKDCGFERQHVDAVSRAGLEDRVVWVSWIPQVLARLSRMAPGPLFLSHTNLLQYPVLARVARPWRRSIRRWGPFVLQGEARHGDELEHLAHGYQHSLVCDGLPSNLADTLARSGGGVCLHYLLGGARVGEFCRDRGLRLWLFTARNPGHFLRLARRDDVDVVFSDDARAVLARYHSADTAVDTA